MKIKEVVSSEMFLIAHEELATDHTTYAETIIEASDKNDALEIFLAGPYKQLIKGYQWLRAPTIKDVHQLKYWKKLN